MASDPAAAMAVSRIVSDSTIGSCAQTKYGSYDIGKLAASYKRHVTKPVTGKSLPPAQ